MKLASFLESMEISTKDAAWFVPTCTCTCLFACAISIRDYAALQRARGNILTLEVWTLFRIIDSDQSGLIDLEACLLSCSGCVCGDFKTLNPCHSALLLHAVCSPPTDIATLADRIGNAPMQHKMFAACCNVLAVTLFRHHAIDGRCGMH